MGSTGAPAWRLAYARCCSPGLPPNSLSNPKHTPILQVGTLRPKQATGFGQGHAAGSEAKCWRPRTGPVGRPLEPLLAAPLQVPPRAPSAHLAPRCPPTCQTHMRLQLLHLCGFREPPARPFLKNKARTVASHITSNKLLAPQTRQLSMPPWPL